MTPLHDPPMFLLPAPSFPAPTNPYCFTTPIPTCTASCTASVLYRRTAQYSSTANSSSSSLSLARRRMKGSVSTLRTVPPGPARTYTHMQEGIGDVHVIIGGAAHQPYAEN